MYVPSAQEEGEGRIAVPESLRNLVDVKRVASICRRIAKLFSATGIEILSSVASAPLRLCSVPRIWGHDSDRRREKDEVRKSEDRKSEKGVHYVPELLAGKLRWRRAIRSGCRPIVVDCVCGCECFANDGFRTVSSAHDDLHRNAVTGHRAGIDIVLLALVQDALVGKRESEIETSPG